MQTLNDIWAWQEIPEGCGMDGQVAIIKSEVSGELCSRLIPALIASRGNPEFAPSKDCDLVQWQGQMLELVNGWTQQTNIIWCSGCLRRFLKEAVILRTRYDAFVEEENAKIMAGTERDSDHE